METKTCKYCNKIKDVTEFHKDKSSKDGRVSKCKICTKEYDKAFWLIPEPKESVVKTLPVPDNAKFENGAVTVECKNCHKRFTPTRGQILARIQAWKNFGQGESNLYCSDECKQACPLYGFHSNSVDPKSSLYVEPKKVKRVRACQNNSLKQAQCDEVGYNYCEKCGDIIDVELHHTLPVAQFGDDAINPAGHILLCAGCHVRIHAECK